MIGYQTVTLKATQGQRLNVIMKEMSYELDGVVVIGYGSVAKKDLTGAVGVVSGKDLKDMPVSNINNVLQGKVPGMTVSSSSGTPGAGRRRTGLCETGSEPRRGIYVSRTGARFGSHHRDIRSCS